jgi:hypothetical protein
VDAARSPADTRRPTVTRGTADPDAGFRDPARAPDAAIGVIALDAAHRAGIGARRPSRMRRGGACAQSDGYQQGAQRCLSHDYRPAFLAERESAPTVEIISLLRTFSETYKPAYAARSNPNRPPKLTDCRTPKNTRMASVSASAKRPS